MWSIKKAYSAALTAILITLSGVGYSAPGVVEVGVGANLIVKNGILMGATGVIIDGNSYTVRFADGTCANLFGGCNSVSDFSFSLRPGTNVSVIGDAFLGQVLVDGPKGNFDSNPNLVFGCSFLLNCTTYIPFNATSFGVARPSMTSIVNSRTSDLTSVVGGSVAAYVNYDSAIQASSNYAVLSKNSTSLPIISANPAAPQAGYLTGTIDSRKTSTIVITHGWQGETYSGTPPPWVTETQQAILARSPDANVVTWTWRDAFVPINPNLTGLAAIYDAAKDAQPYTASQGQMLAEALKSAGATNIHFIGHSLGTYVNALATRNLTEAGTIVQQVTILDRPFSNEPGEESMFRATLAGVQRIDNYYGGFASTGADLAGAYNHKFPNASHSGVHDDYQETIENTSLREGFYWSAAGGGVGQIDSPFFSPSSVRLPLTRTSLFPVESELLKTFNATASGSASTLTLTMSEGSPAYIWTDWTIPLGAQFFSFDFFWGDRGDGDFLTVYFGDTLLFSFLGTDFTDDEFINSGLHWIGRFAGQTGQLLFALNNVGGVNADLTIRNLVLYSSDVPAPATMALLFIGLAGIAATRRRRTL